jgi:hypothetical protein
MRLLEYTSESGVAYPKCPVMVANGTVPRIALHEHIKIFGRLTREKTLQ